MKRRLQLIPREPLYLCITVSNLWKNMFLTLYWKRLTSGKTITSVTVNTATKWWMINHSTVRIQTTRSKARINTFLVNTSLRRSTISTDGTLRSTVGCTTDHIRHARALCLSGHHLALRIGSARWWIARVRWKRWQGSFFYHRVRNWCYELN